MAQPIKLPDENVAELLVRQRELHDILPTIDALEQCGADCTIPREQYLKAHGQIANLLRLFGPESFHEVKR